MNGESKIAMATYGDVVEYQLFCAYKFQTWDSFARQQFEDRDYDLWWTSRLVAKKWKRRVMKCQRYIDRVAKMETGFTAEIEDVRTEMEKWCKSVTGRGCDR